MKRRDPFQAIADPTRRSIISMVAKESLNLNSVAERFSVSRPAISKHIKILSQCGLITIRQKGRERFCEAQLEGLNEISTWLAEYKQFWEAKLDNLETYISEIPVSKVEEGKEMVEIVPEAAIATEIVAEVQTHIAPITVEATETTGEAHPIIEPISIKPEEIKSHAPRKVKKKPEVTDIYIQQGSLFG